MFDLPWGRAPRLAPKESPLGGMGGMGIHMVDMFINLAGRIAEVTVQSHARVLENGLDDTTAGLFRFESGVTANFATLALAPRWPDAEDIERARKAHPFPQADRLGAQPVPAPPRR